MSQDLLKRVADSPNKIKKLDSEEVEELCSEIREELLNTLAKTGGHLASNLGAVELTVALHRNFNLPKDKIVFGLPPK